MDIGDLLQTWRLITAFRTTAMMTWDFWALALAFVVAVVYFLQANKAELRKETQLKISEDCWQCLPHHPGCRGRVDDFCFNRSPIVGGPTVIVSFLLSAFLAGMALVWLVGE